MTDFLINMGYKDEAPKELTVKFQEKGTYYFEEMKIVAQPMEQLSRQGKEVLQQENLENVKLLTNEVRGTISVDKEKMLCVTLPYSTGWSAYVDGVETEVFQADTMFMAILVPEGNHEIRFAYCTPYLRAGAVLSILGIGSIVVMIVRQKRKEKGQNESDTKR